MILSIMGNIFLAILFISVIFLELFVLLGALFIIGKTVWNLAKKQFKLYEEKMDYKYRNIKIDGCVYSDKCDGRKIYKEGEICPTYCVMYETRYGSEICSHKKRDSGIPKRKKKEKTTP